MACEYYKVKSQLQVSNDESIPVLRPDHVSLGKCVTSHQFIRKYGTINDIEIVNMLRDGCHFRGFKKIKIESNEEEGFANMHHVLQLSSKDLDFYKEVCVQRVNRLTVDIANLTSNNQVVTDSRSAVIFAFNNKEFIDIFYFGKKHLRYFKMNYPTEDFRVYLTSHILYIPSENKLSVINFGNDIPFLKHMNFVQRPYIIALSAVMFVSYNEHYDQTPVLRYDKLDEHSSFCQLIISESTLNSLKVSETMVVSTGNDIIWLASNNDESYIYKFCNGKELLLVKTIEMKSCFPAAVNFEFQKFCYCGCTRQAFLLYIKNCEYNPNSFIVVVDLKKFKVLSILEMELTLNRKPLLIMCPSWDGTKLFVQETFESKVVFYQVFTLLPSELTLQSITKRCIHKMFSESTIQRANIPKYLKTELLNEL